MAKSRFSTHAKDLHDLLERWNVGQLEAGRLEVDDRPVTPSCRPPRARRLQPALAGPLRHPAAGLLRRRAGSGSCTSASRGCSARPGPRPSRACARMRSGARHLARSRHAVDRQGRDDLQRRRRARRSTAVAGDRSRRRARLADRALRGRHVPRSGAAGWHRGARSPRRSACDRRGPGARARRRREDRRRESRRRPAGARAEGTRRRAPARISSASASMPATPSGRWRMRWPPWKRSPLTC